MPHDEEDLDVHGECAHEIHNLRAALQRIANLPIKRRDGRHDVLTVARAKRVAMAALGAPPQAVQQFCDCRICPSGQSPNNDIIV